MSRRDPKRLADALGTETEESCTTYNMLKVLHFPLAIIFADYLNSQLASFGNKGPLLFCFLLGEKKDIL